MNKQLALAYAATSVATAIAAIAMVGSAFGFGGNPTEPVTEEPVGVAQTVAQLRDTLVQQAIAEVEAQRAEAQATALTEVEVWRAAAISEIEQELKRQFGAITAPPSDGGAYAYAYTNDGGDKREEREHEDEEDEEDEHDEHEKDDD